MHAVKKKHNQQQPQHFLVDLEKSNFKNMFVLLNLFFNYGLYLFAKTFGVYFEKVETQIYN